jgi:hypothetical protein
MNKNKYFDLGLLLVGLALVFLMGCTSIRPMDIETIVDNGLHEDFEKFKIFQYFVSRDIVLTATEVDTQTDVSRGRAFSSTSIHRDYINLLASTPGKCLDYNYDPESDSMMLGIEFDQGSNNLLWFLYDPDDDCFYLEYTNRARQEIVYAGITYKVSYEQATGLDATIKRWTTLNKAGENYQNMEPLLLYEGSDTRRETESRRTLGGSRL